LKIIINNVYAFQYPTKNRCTILVQPSFAKLVLLPIREAYEWKLLALLLIGIFALNLLPIREAYEWKPYIDAKPEGYNGHDPACFQFVKRMNGNVKSYLDSFRGLVLASNS
jgi:hypothetical protein